MLIFLACAVPLFAQLGARPAEEWISELEAPSRIESLKIADVLGKLSLRPGQVVADIGAGTGIFSVQFSRAVKPGGKVYAVEVDEKLLGHILASADEQGILNIEPVYGEYDDPSLPGRIDIAFLNDVLHHIEHREVYLKKLAEYLKPEGRVAIIDFKPGQGEHAGNASLQVSQEQTTEWMRMAGLKPVEMVEGLFPDRWFVIYGR